MRHQHSLSSDRLRGPSEREMDDDRLGVGFRHLSQFLIHLFAVLPREPRCQKETGCDRSTPFAPRILSPSLRLIPPAQSKSHAPCDGTTTRGGRGGAASVRYHKLC